MNDMRFRISEHNHLFSRHLNQRALVSIYAFSPNEEVKSDLPFPAESTVIYLSRTQIERELARLLDGITMAAIR